MFTGWILRINEACLRGHWEKLEILINKHKELVQQRLECSAFLYISNGYQNVITWKFLGSLAAVDVIALLS